jgi:ATP-dependent DNA helicase RecG
MSLRLTLKRFVKRLSNAFCHRDYREYDSVNIAIFKDRVEIRSPGLLYGGLTISDIRRKMLSERRNELMSELFHPHHGIPNARQLEYIT